MKIPKSAIFVAGLSIALFLITLIVISITAHQENAAKPKPAEKQIAPILIEYKPETGIYLTLRGYNRNESPEPQTVVMNYSIQNGLTNKEILYTRWINFEDYYNMRKAEIKNNKLILTSFLYGTDISVPFLADEFYAEDGKLIHAASIVFKSSDIKQKTSLSLKNKILEYKHKKYNDNIHKLEEGTWVVDNLLILALCEDKEAIQLLKDRSAYDKYFNVELDGAYGEVHSAAAGAYETYEYLRKQGGSIKEVIPPDGAATR